MVSPCHQNDPEMHDFFCEKLELPGAPSGASFIAFRDAAGMVGGWMMERYTGPGGIVHSHIAGNRPGWITRHMLRIWSLYVFGQLRCEASYGDVKRANAPAARMAEKMGGKLEAVLEDYFPDDDLLIYKLKRADCRWLPRSMRERPQHG